MPPTWWSAAVGLVGLADEATRERQTFTGLVVGGASVATSDPNGPLLADVARRLERRDQIDTDRLAALRVAYMAAVMDAQRRRHTPQDFTEDTGYVDAYRRARAYEAASKIRFEGKQMRSDIGAHAEAAV